MGPTSPGGSWSSSPAPCLRDERRGPAAGAATQQRLYADRKIEVPIMTWNDRRLLRISVQGYNTREDIDALTSVLAGLLAEPSRSG